MRMTFLEAAERVLKEAGQSLHYRLITKRALEGGLLSTNGLTPDDTMRARLGEEIARAEEAGRPAKFRRVGRGVYDLVRRTESYQQQIKKHNASIRKRLRERLMALDPDLFEHLIGRVLGCMGFEDLQVTKRSHDGGVDVRGVLIVGNAVRTRMAVQAKRWKGSVGSKIVTQLRGSLLPNEQGLIVTTGKFSGPAREEAQHHQKQPIDLVDGEGLIDLLFSYRLGVKKHELAIYELDEEDEFLGEGVNEEEEEGLGPYSRLAIHAKRKGKTFKAVFVDMATVEAEDGKMLGSPSGAAKRLTKGASINGWRWWRFVDPEDGEEKLLDALRGGVEDEEHA